MASLKWKTGRTHRKTKRPLIMFSSSATPDYKCCGHAKSEWHGHLSVLHSQSKLALPLARAERKNCDTANALRALVLSRHRES